MPHYGGRFLCPTTSRGHLLITSGAQVFDVLGISEPIKLLQDDAQDEAKAFPPRKNREKSSLRGREALLALIRELDVFPPGSVEQAALTHHDEEQLHELPCRYRKQGLKLLRKK